MGPEREPERSGLAQAGPAPRANLNGFLRDVVQHLLDKGPHAAFFRNAVSCVVVDDYRNYVPAEKEMYLSKILERTEAQHYVEVAAFRADLQQMYDNAVAYNGRRGGTHAYEPVIHWAADLLAIADKELQQRAQELQVDSAEQRQPCDGRGKSDAAMVEAAGETTMVLTAPVADTVANQPPSSASPSPPSMSPPAQPCEGAQLESLQQDQQQQDPLPQQGLARQLSPVQEQQQEPQEQQAHGATAAGGQGSPRGANGSAGQQSSSPSSGSGDAAHSGLEALLAACELAAEQDSSAPRSGGAGDAAANTAAPERRSYPGCGGDALAKNPAPQTGGVEGAPDPGAGSGPLSAARQQQQQAVHGPQQEDPAGSSEGAGMALCSVRGGAGGGAEGVVSTAQPQPGAGASGGAGQGGGPGPGGSYLASNAFKNRRHKSKVYIKPNKVVYLPTTFVEEEFDVTALPMDCELRVEADGALTDESFKVTIKAVPRQGLSTMYCMTNVMRFQQQYLNWQIFNWTRVDNSHIKIHLQSPSPSQTQLQRPDLDRAASMPEQVGRSLQVAGMRGSEDGQARGGGGGGGTTSSSLKRKSDTGRYNFAPRVERRLAPEPGGRDMPMDLRLSSTGLLQYPSPIPESPPASPQRRASTCIAGGGGQGCGAGAAALPPRGPSAQALGGGLHGRLSHHPHAVPHQVHVHIHQHNPGGPTYQPQPLHAQQQQQQRLQQHQQQQLYQPHSHSNPCGIGGGGGHNTLALPFPLQHHPHQQQAHPHNYHNLHQQQQRGSNSSIRTDQQTCSEDSSGPAAGADAASMPPLPLTWHQSAAATVAAGARPGARAAGARGPAGAGPPPGLHHHALELQIQELAEHLQMQAQAAGGELPTLAALQLAVTALQHQQQQQQHHQQQQQLLAAVAAAPPRGAGGDAAPLDLSNPADQERLLQQLVGGAGGGISGGAPPPLHAHPHSQLHQQHGGAALGRAPRGSGGAPPLLELDMAAVTDSHGVAVPSSSARRSGSGNGDGMMVYAAQCDGAEYDAAAAATGAGTGAGLARGGGLAQQQRRPSNSGTAAEPYLQQLQQPPPQQQRRTSHGDRCRPQGTLAVGFDREQADARAAVAAEAAMEEGQQRGGLAAAAMEEGDEEVHHIVCHPHPRRSGNGGVAGTFFQGASGAAGGGRILLEVAPLAGGGAGSGRVSGSGRHGEFPTQQHQLGSGVGAHMGMGMAQAFPQGLELGDCTQADLISYLSSPNKRFKIAVSADNTAAAAAAAAAAAVAVGGGELSVLDVLGLRAAAGGLPAPAEAAALAAALRQGGGGATVGVAGAFSQAAAAAALGGRAFLPVGPEVMGQLM